MDDYIGMIKLFAGAQPPRGWQLCQGQKLAINTNQALYSILGVLYGGDGVTTFGLPNLQGAVPLGAGVSPAQGTFNVGQTGGKETIPLTLANLPGHTHGITGNASMSCNIDGAETPEPNGAYPSISETNTYALPATSTGLMPVTGTVTGGAAGTGSNADKRMPFVAINYIICVSGFFPPRN